MPDNTGPEHDQAASITDGKAQPDAVTESSRQPWLTQLHDVDIISVSGADSERFLQGQLSCNMSQLTDSHSLRAALCNLKGRVIADLRVLRLDQSILLMCSAGMADIVLTTLTKYSVFFKTSLQKVSDHYVVLGVAGADSESLLASCGVSCPQTQDACTQIGGGVVARIQEAPARFCCVLSDAHAELATTLSSRFASGSEEDWRLADITACVAHIRPGQQELHTPQVLNYDLNGTIDFKKGCYTGQEVVARMYYRAEAKKRLRYISWPTSQVEPSGGDVIDSIERPSGQTHALAIMPVSTE